MTSIRKIRQYLKENGCTLDAAIDYSDDTVKVKVAYPGVTSLVTTFPDIAATEDAAAWRSRLLIALEEWRCLHTDRFRVALLAGKGPDKAKFDRDMNAYSALRGIVAGIGA